MPSSTRRGLLRTLPALTVGLAGCSGLTGDEDEPPVNAAWQYGEHEPQSVAFGSETLLVGNSGPFSDDPLVAGLDPETGERQWAVTTEKGEKSPVSADDERAYAYSKAGELLAIDHEAGETVWRRSVRPIDEADPGITDFAPIRSGDQVLVPVSGTEDDVPDRLLGFGIDGEPAFTRPFERSVSGAPASAGDGGAVVPLLNGYVHRIAADGSRHWTQRLGGSLSAVAVTGETVYVGSATEELVALSLGDGSVRWRTPLRNTVFTRPVVADGTVYVGGADYRLRALDAETGEQRWGRELSSAVTHGPFLVADRLVTLVGGKRRVRGQSGTVPFQPTELFVHRLDGSLVRRIGFDGYPDGGPVEWLGVAGGGVYVGQAFGLTRANEVILDE